MRKTGMKRFIALTMVLCTLMVLATGCGNKNAQAATAAKSKIVHPKIQMEMKDGSKMVFELYPEYAPETVNNFVKLSKAGFYNGLTFHRIIKGFMVQGGDPLGNGTGGASKNIKGEFKSNGFTKNTLKHVKGVISMARGKDLNSASSQFFIMDGPGDFLDGNYAAFGKLISGAATLDKIANTPVVLNTETNEQSQPKTPVIIKKVTVLTQK